VVVRHLNIIHLQDFAHFRFSEDLFPGLTNT
jgi:hypothetical protein